MEIACRTGLATEYQDVFYSSLDPFEFSSPHNTLRWAGCIRDDQIQTVLGRRM